MNEIPEASGAFAPTTFHTRARVGTPMTRRAGLLVQCGVRLSRRRPLLHEHDVQVQLRRAWEISQRPHMAGSDADPDVVWSQRGRLRMYALKATRTREGALGPETKRAGGRPEAC